MTTDPKPKEEIPIRRFIEYLDVVREKLKEADLELLAAVASHKALCDKSDPPKPDPQPKPVVDDLREGLAKAISNAMQEWPMDRAFSAHASDAALAFLVSRGWGPVVERAVNRCEDCHGNHDTGECKEAEARGFNEGIEAAAKYVSECRENRQGVVQVFDVMADYLRALKREEKPR